MATRNTDVNLIIRARNEADQAISAVTAALAKLTSTQGAAGASADKVGKQVKDLGATLLGLDKIAGTLSGAYEKASATASRQAAALHASGAAIAENKLKIDDLKRALELLKAEQDKTFVGPRRDGLSGMVKGVESQLASAERQVARLSKAFESNLAGLQTTRSGLLELRGATATLAETQNAATAAVDRDTAARERRATVVKQARADEERMTANAQAAQSFFNNRFGGASAPTRGPASSNGATFDALTENFHRLEAEARKVREAVDPVGVAVEQAEAKIAKLRSLVQGGFLGTDAALAREKQIRDALHATTAELDGSAKAARTASDSEKRMADEARHLREQLDPLAAMQQRFNDKLVRFRELAAAGKISTDELATAEKHLTEEKKRAEAALGAAQGNRPRVSLFGLAPYETQNLFYQLNDVVTQLSSGTSLTQTLAQQGGQIFQLFQNRIGPAIAAAFKNPYFLAAAAVLTTIALGLKRAADEAERLRSITGELTLSADGGAYDAAKIEDSAQALRGYGASIDDATAAMKLFAREGVNAERFDEFGRAAQNMVDVTGVKLPEAAKQLADAFTGGYEAIAKLDDKTNFLTATQRIHIKTLFEEGQAQRARADAFDIFSDKLSKAADQQRGAGTDAARSLGKAYNDLMDSLGQTAPIQTLIGLFGSLAEKISQATGNAATFTTVAARAERIAELQGKIKTLQDSEDAQRQFVPRGWTNSVAQWAIGSNLNAKLLGEMRSELAQLQGQVAKEAQSESRAAADTLAANREEQKKGDIRLGEATDRLRVDGARRLSAERGITSERDKQLRLTVRERELRTQAETIGGTPAAQAAFVAQGLENERAAIRKEESDAARAAAAARKAEIDKFLERVIGAEGGNQKNKAGSGADGYGQFIPSTYLEYFRKVYGDTGQSRDEILATRRDATISKGVLDAFTRDNARALERMGQAVTAGNLYLAHFLGNAGAKAVLNARGDTPVDQVIRRYERNPARLQQTLSQNAGYLRVPDEQGRSGKGRYRTADELEAFIGKRVGDTGAAQSAGQVAITKLIDDSKEKQDDFNTSVRQNLDDRQRIIDAQRAEFGLSSLALIEEERRLAIAKDVFDLNRKAEDANKNLKPGQTPVVVTPEQVADVERLAGAMFDAARAADVLKARLSDQQQPLTNLEQQRDLLREQAEFLRSIGDNQGADKLEGQIDEINAKIAAAVQALIAFYRSLTPEQLAELGVKSAEELQILIDKLELGTKTTQQWGKVAGVSAQDIARAFASGAVNSFTNFINKVAAGKNVFKALADGVREFAANFISSIAQMILQLLAYAAAVSILRALGVPVPAGIGVGTKHTGGIVGQADGNGKRQISMAAMAGAVRYHSGGVAGLRPNEVVTVLEKGEEVLTASSPRHIANMGKGGTQRQSSPNTTVINVMDEDAGIQAALQRPAGERVLFNFLRNNSAAVKAALAT